MAMARAAVHENTSGSLRPPPSAWEDIKDLTPAGARLLANNHIHLNTARRLVEEVRSLPAWWRRCACPEKISLAHNQITNALNVQYLLQSNMPCIANNAALPQPQVGFSSPEDLADITEAEVSLAGGRGGGHAHITGSQLNTWPVI